MINRVSRIHRIHSPVGVHGALEELAGPEVPEQHEPDPGADGQDVPLEGDGADPAPGVTRGYLPDRLQRPAVQEIRVSLNITDGSQHRDHCDEAPTLLPTAYI